MNTTTITLQDLITEVKHNIYMADCLQSQEDTIYYIESFLDYHEIKNVNKKQLAQQFNEWIVT